MIKRIILSFTILLSISNFAIAQRLVKLNMLEKSPLSNMVVYSTNDSTARYTKLLAGTGIQINYNEGDTTLTIIATGTSVGVPQELSLNDATRELSITDGNTVDLSESIQDEVATLLQAGSNVTLTYDDGAGTLTIAATGGGGGATNLGDLGDVTITSATTGQVLKYDGAEWINAAESGGIALTDLSVTTNAAGSAALSYNNTNGVFSYTPPDLSSYLTSAQLANLTDIDMTGLANEYILKYNSSAQEWKVKENNIDGLSDGYYNPSNTATRRSFFLGKIPKNLSPSSPPNVNGADNFSILGMDSLTTGYENLSIGVNSLKANKTGHWMVSIGKNTLGGALFAYNNYDFTGNNNVAAGYSAFALDTLVVNTVGIGSYVNTDYYGSGPDSLGSITNGVFIGSYVHSKYEISNNEIVIGALATGNGSNTATFGNNSITATYLKGTMNFNGYGLGNKEAADLSKTGSGYFLEVATDGTLIESTVTGGSAQTLSFDDATRELSISSGNTVDLSEGIQDEVATLLQAGSNVTLTYDDGAGTLTIAATGGGGATNLGDLGDVTITSATTGQVLKYDGTKWVNGTDLIDDADADPANEIQTITASNGLTATATGDDYDIKLGGTLSDATTTIDMNNNALTFTNNGGYNLSGTGGLSFTNTSATDYSSVLSLAGTNTRIYADGGTTEPLNSINLTSSRSGVKEMDIRSSVSNDNGTYTLIALNPTRLSIKTPNVTDVTAQNGQFLKLVDRLTGEVEFDDIIDLTSLSVTTNSAGTAALSYNNTNGVFTYTPPDLSSYLTAEVDGSVTNEIQDLSLSGNTLSLSGDATTVDLSGYLDEATTASNGLTEVGNDIRLGGTLSTSVDIDALSTYNFSITDAANLTLSSSTVIEFNAGAGGVINNSTNFFQIGRSLGKILDFTQGTLRMDGYGVGNKEASDLSLTGSAYLASFATDGTLIEYPISSISGESTTASNGLTLSGSDVKLGGTLSEITNISMAGFNASIYDVSSNTGFAIQPSLNLIVNYGTQAFDDYGSGNKEAADLSKTKSNYKAAFATDGTLIEVDDIDAMVVACSDETTDITTGTAKVTFRAPHAMTITGVRASLTTASSSGNPTVDINEGGTSILGTKLTIDANEKTSTTAATAATITDTAIADDAEITIDIDAAGTGATGLKVTILYRKN